MASPNTKKTKDIEQNELYNTPEIALESFYEQFPEVFDSHFVYFDPCNGLGKISNFLQSLDKKVYTNDIIDYGIHQDYVENFLDIEKIPDDVDCIIFNPPFTLTEQFVDHAVKLCDNHHSCQSVLMFNRMTTIESNSRARKFKSKEWGLDTMYQFGFRVSCTKGVNEESTANSVAYSWFEFKKRHVEHPKLKWITK